MKGYVGVTDDDSFAFVSQQPGIEGKCSGLGLTLTPIVDWIERFRMTNSPSVSYGFCTTMSLANILKVFQVSNMIYILR